MPREGNYKGTQAPFPVARILPYMEEYLAKHTQADLRALTGISERQLYCMRHGQQKTMTLRVADRVLSALGHVDVLHVELADIYRTA